MHPGVGPRFQVMLVVAAPLIALIRLSVLAALRDGRTLRRLTRMLV